MGEERIKNLYGNSAGQWALLETPVGLVPPPTLRVGIVPSQSVEITYLGEPASVVAGVYARLAPAGRGPRGSKLQETLAAFLGVGKQQSVSRYVTGANGPRLTDAGWSALVQAHFSPSLVTASAQRSAEGAPKGDNHGG